MIQPLLTESDLLNNYRFLLTCQNSEGLKFKEYTTTVNKVEVVYTQEYEGDKLFNHYVEIGIAENYRKLSSIQRGTDLIHLIKLLQ
jgi:hypothetical protein